MKNIVCLCLLVLPAPVLAHSGHGPGEPEHWLIGLVFVGLALALCSSLRSKNPQQRDTPRSKRRDP